MKQVLLLLLIAAAFSAGCAKKNLSGESGNITQINEASQLPDGTDEIVKGNSVKESGIADPQNHTGTFDVTMSGYKGEIFIGVADGMFFGTILFYNWGNGTPQPLKSLKVNEDKIYFIRSINTKDEIEKYGATTTFSQEFYGIFSKDRKMIRGYYRYTGTQDNWEAIRK